MGNSSDLNFTSFANIETVFLNKDLPTDATHVLILNSGKKNQIILSK